MIQELEKLGNVILYDPNFNFNSDDIDKFANDTTKKYMFKIKDLDMIAHCKKLYKKINSKDKFILISHSRGYLLATFFASIYSQQIIGYINLDGGLTAEGVKKYIGEIPDYSKITSDLKKIFLELKKENKTEYRNKLADIVKYHLYEQYLHIDYKFETFPVYVFNNIYNDNEINLLMDDYIKTTLIEKIDYNTELSKFNPNTHSIYYIGLTHWFYFGKEEDIIESVKKILGWKLSPV